MKPIIYTLIAIMIFLVGYKMGWRAYDNWIEKNIHNHWEKKIYRGEL